MALLVLRPLSIFLCVIVQYTAVKAFLEYQQRHFSHFRGGSMSFTSRVDDKSGSIKVLMEVMTAWEPGKGPCGPRCLPACRNCTARGINTNTDVSREEMMRTYNDPYYFGHWIRERPRIPERPHGLHITEDDITQNVKDNLNEVVVYVGNTLEVDRAIFQIEYVTGDSYEDISMEGYGWGNFTLQNFVGHGYHIQMKINDLVVRSDTVKPNNSPKYLYNPLIRLPLNKTNVIKLPIVDDDNDIITCSMGKYILGTPIDTNPLPHIHISEDCQLTIVTNTSFGYGDGTIGAVAIIINDTPRQSIALGNTTYRPGLTLSSSTAQFLIETYDESKAASIIDPTPADGQRFTVYNGSDWHIEVHSKPNPLTVNHFIYAFGMYGEVIKTVEDAKSSGAEKVFATLTPIPGESRDSALCIVAGDRLDDGHETDITRCYFIQTRNAGYVRLDATAIRAGRAHFFSWPTDNAVHCMKGNICTFPIFVTPMETTVSDSMCNRIFIDLPDPCTSFPCVGGGTCNALPDNSDYICTCLHATGKNCETRIRACDSNPCRNGAKCYDFYPESYYCLCPSEWKGKNCDVRNSDP